MIDIKELKIGNYLRDIDSGDIGFVIGLYYDDESSKDTEITLDVRRTCDNPCRGITQARERSFEPILLTEDEFVKFGFTIISRDLYTLNINSFYISITDDSRTIGRDFHIYIKDDAFITVLSADIQYVHQLQNAIYFATNVNIEFDV